MIATLFEHPLYTLIGVGVVAFLLFTGKLDGVIAAVKRALAPKPATGVQTQATIHTPPQATVESATPAALAAKYDRHTLAMASILAAKAFAEQQEASKAAEAVLTNAHNIFANAATTPPGAPQTATAGPAPTA